MGGNRRNQAYRQGINFVNNTATSKETAENSGKDKPGQRADCEAAGFNQGWRNENICGYSNIITHLHLYITFMICMLFF